MSELAGTSSTTLRIREAVRAVIVDPERRVLLVRFEFPARHVWAMPGGGIEPAETVEDALRRELSEELGLEDPVIGPQVWERTHIIPFLDGLWDGQHDRFFLVETESFEPRPHLTWEQLHAEHLFEIRWWSPDELAAFTPTRDLCFAPRRLPEVYASLIADGVPATPIDTGR
jgi:8-oxo-dGTP pyrophosphatase MutT (NUDIX family)